MTDIAHTPLYLADRGEVTAATDLIIQYGVHAADEAAARANRSRTVGNHIRFSQPIAELAAAR